MVSDTIYELCLPILQNSGLEEEDKTEKLEDLLAKEAALTGTQLENAVLNVLWQYRESATSSKSPPPMRHTVVRRHSPAPWQMPRMSTPQPSSSPGFGTSPAIPSAFNRGKSSTASPFTSPRPSPRLAFMSPQIPHSPSLNGYEVLTETGPPPEIYGDFGSDNVDWIVNDDSASNASSAGARGHESVLSGAAAEYIQPQQINMSPYDMLRSVLGEAKTDEEIETALQANSYDLSATIMTLMESQNPEMTHANNLPLEQESTILVGKSMSPGAPRPTTPNSQGRSKIVCRYWMSSGTCLRADCRFSHDSSNQICKYWIVGNCLAGDTCPFSHDPSTIINRLSVEDNMGISNIPQLNQITNLQPNFQIQDYNAFPNLQQQVMQDQQWASSYQNSFNAYSHANLYPSLAGGPLTYRTMPNSRRESSPHRSHSRPSSRHQSREPTPSVPAVDDTEAFPSLGAASGKGAKKHHGKRGGHGHAHKDSKESFPNSLADIVRLSPSPSPSQGRKSLKASKSANGINSRAENSAAAQNIPSPQHVPWLETGEKANKLYLKARQDAIKHGGLRNKFLQSAAQAWNRNDARAAKALSLRGQSENDLMRKAHREAARQLYEERNRHGGAKGELYVDLHGLHPEESVEYLERVLLEQQSSAQPVYAITGTGHHSKNGKDKVGKAIRGFLNEWRYAYREFSVPGDRNNVGGILGIDPKSFDKNIASGSAAAAAAAADKASDSAETADATDDSERPSPPPVLLETLMIKGQPRDIILAKGQPARSKA
ncbi:MAG: hypothetical protein M1829_003355 [Trizodia sp. TS-e1964]|nr:MAG: hypothetical protein M1829_003355 [Trizodia sp. TS-e1964]